MKLHRIAIVPLTIFALVSCQLELPPVASATVERHSFDQTTQSINLSSEQVRVLASWFAEHPSGWSRSVVSYVPTLEVRLTHTSGETSVVNIMGTKVIIYNRSGQFEQQFYVSSLTNLLSVVDSGG
jgi:hypothetical protein